MSGYVVVGTQWGDEGKGKIVDVLSEKADMIVRFQGGNNAGHTVVVNGTKHILHLLPSGCLHPHAQCIIGPGVVVDPFVFLQELQVLEKKGIDTGHIYISERAHILMPYHILIDQLQEERAGYYKIGTTKRGIGPCYADKYERVGLRMHDLCHFESFQKKLYHNLQQKNAYIEKVYGAKPFVYEQLVKDFSDIRNRLLPRIIETTARIHQALKEDRFVLFEGAQAAMLDINYGTYPYVTSSSPTAAGVCTGAGVSPQSLTRIIGVMKAYSTRVGEGPFVSELLDEKGEYLRKKGAEFGATTGRPRRCGWLDLLAVRHAAMINGLTDLVVTKLDILSGMEEINVCIGYEIHGSIYEYMPAALEDLQCTKPVYKVCKGWKEDIRNITNYHELPDNCRAYLRFIEEFTDVPISMISVGPDRTHNIFVKDLTK